MKKVAVLLAPGFEEAEAIVTLDILRRLNIEVETTMPSYCQAGRRAALILPPVRRSSSLYPVMIRQECSFARYVLRPRACWAATVC